jgi:hypothetical protein
MEKSLSSLSTQVSGINNIFINLSENQQKALDYIKNNKIDALFTEMLNNVVASGTNEPVVHMVIIIISKQILNLIKF